MRLTQRDISEVDRWKLPPPKKSIIVTMIAQYKGRKKPLPYIVEEEDD
jgi:hypothetical protein